MKPTFGVRKILAACIIGGKRSAECRLRDNGSTLNPSAIRETQAAGNAENVPADHTLVFCYDNRTVIGSQFHISGFIYTLQEVHSQTSRRNNDNGVTFTIRDINIIQAVNGQTPGIPDLRRADGDIHGSKRFVIGMNAFAVQLNFRLNLTGTG